MNRISALIEETPECSLAPSTMRTQGKDGCLRTTKQVLTRHLDLKLFSLQNCENEISVVISHLVYGILW